MPNKAKRLKDAVNAIGVITLTRDVIGGKGRSKGVREEEGF